MCATPVLKMRHFLAQIFVLSQIIFTMFKDFEMNFRIGKPNINLFGIWVSYFLQLPL